MTDQWQPCPRCGSKQVRTWDHWRSIFSMIPLAFGGCIFLIGGILFWPLWIVAIFLFLLAPLSFVPMFYKIKTCKNCKLMWNPKKMKKVS